MLRIPMRKRVTHQAIANALGFHKSTVSRSLREDPSIPPETRRQVCAKAEELGYRPDPILSELAAFRWQGTKVERGVVIASIVSRRPEGSGGLDLSSALRDEAAKLGYKLEEFHREAFPNSATLQGVLRSRGITDIILGTVHDQAHIVDLDWSRFVAVQLLPGFFAVPLHSVVRNHFNVVVTAWRKAVERGYRRIGTVFLEHSFPIIDDVLRMSGVHACQQQIFPHLASIPPLRYGDVCREHFAVFREWINNNEPDVLIGFSSAHESIFHSLFGCRIPYISLHNTPPSELSGIDDAPATYAREAINLLNFCRRSNQWGVPKQRIDHVLEPTWVEGNSLPINSP